MKTLLLFVPSALALIGLVWHAWHYRGRRIALTFFPAAFLFGAVRGNAIHWIAVDMQDGVMPYIFAHPAIRVFSAPLQAVIGWMFALYVSWWLAEQILARIPPLQKDLMATVGLACIGMGALAYATEAGAASAGWWLWSIPARNRFFIGVPAVGIAEWFAVGFEFLIPYLLAVCSPYRGRLWPHALWGIYLFHLFLHLFGRPISDALPTQPFVLWHGVSLLIMAGLALTGIGTVQIESRAVASEDRSSQWVMWGAIGLFTAVMATAQAGIGGRPDLLISLVPLALLALLAMPAVPLAGAVLAGLAAWAVGRFGFTFLPGPVVAFGMLAGRARWGRRNLVRIGVCGALMLVAVGLYREGRALGRRSGKYLYHIARADAYARQGQAAWAAREHREARTLEPLDVESYLQVGYALEQHGLPRLAASQYRKAIQLEQRLFLGHYDLGCALEIVGDVKGAEAAYLRSVEIAPRFYQGQLRLGALYLEQGKADLAVTHFLRAVEIEPGKPEAYNNLGVAYQQQGKADLAMAAWHQALNRNPKFADAYSNIGDAYLFGGQPEAAVHAYEAAIEIDSMHARARRGLMMARFQMGAPVKNSAQITGP